jgi:hypothetical protein
MSHDAAHFAVPDAPAGDAVRHDWRDTLRSAADLAVLGFLVTGAALPLVTAGAAVATGSAAIDHHLDTDSWPPARQLWAVFRRALLPGLGVSVLVLAVAALVTVDVLALGAGAVPGGLPLTVLLLALAVPAAGFTGLLVVAAPSPTPLAEARAMARPGLLAAIGAVIVLVLVLALLVHPVLTPLLVGYGLFALHVISRRRSS